MIERIVGRIKRESEWKPAPIPKDAVIKEAKRYGIDLTPYYDKVSDGDKLYEIFLGLENGIDVSSYVDDSLNSKQMKIKRLLLQE